MMGEELFDPRSDRDDLKNVNVLETQRVQLLYLKHVTERMRRNNTKEGAERTQFAKDWVELAGRTDSGGYLRMPGEPSRGEGRTPEQVYDHHVDAARLQLRWLTVGRPAPDWVLIGVESVICDRSGLAMPSGFYTVQQSLDI